MSEKRHRNRKKSEKVKADTDSWIESDEHFGFIAGYNSNGVPYGLTHEEWDEINSETKKEKNLTPSVFNFEQGIYIPGNNFHR